MRVDHIVALGSGKQAADGPAVVQRVGLDALEDRCETRLTGAISPDLRDRTFRGVQGFTDPMGSGEENAGALFPAIDGHQHASVQDHRASPKRLMASVTACSCTGPRSVAHASSAWCRAS